MHVLLFQNGKVLFGTALFFGTGVNDKSLPQGNYKINLVIEPIVTLD